MRMSPEEATAAERDYYAPMDDTSIYAKPETSKEERVEHARRINEAWARQQAEEKGEA